MATNETNNGQDRRPSPYAYYRRLRPEYFSDTIVKYEVPLTQELFDLQLNLLSTKKMQSEFENFVVGITKRVITPNIKPQTGPDGGGDGKVDAETFEVSDDISDKWHSTEETAHGKEYWAFAISCKKTWRTKIKSDIEKIVATNRGYTKALFFTNQYVKSSTRAEVEEELTKEYNIIVKIFDANALSKWVFHDGCIDIALSTLGFSDTYKQKYVSVGPNDKKRKEILLQIEQNILRHVEGLDTQYIDELHDACILSRGLERPRKEIEGRFERAIRECKSHGSQQQLFNIIYDLAWTCYFWFEDCEATYQHYLTLKDMIDEDCNVTRAEKITNTLTNLINASRAEEFSHELIKSEIDYIKKLKLELDTNPFKKSSALFLAIYIQEQRLIERMINGESIDEELKSIKPLLIESASHLEISMESQFKVIEMLSKYVEDNEIFEQLVDELAEIVADKRSKAEAAKVRLSRANDHIDKHRWSSAIKQLGFCVYAFEQEECMTELIRSSGLMGIALSNLGLLYSAEAYLVKAASFLVQDFYHSGLVSHLLVSVLHELCGIELKLGRIIMYFNWYELLSVISINGQFNEEDSYKSYCSQEDGAWTCRFAVSDLKNPSIAKLPDILERLGMFSSSEYLKYVLGYPEDVDPNYLSVFEDIANSSKLKEQPVHEHFYDKLNISTSGATYAKTTVNNFTITINYENDPKVQRIAELFLASIESFMATSEMFEIVAVHNQITINITHTENDSELIYNQVTNDYEFRLNLHTFNENVWWQCFVNYLVHMLTKNAMTQEPIETMIENKQNGERLMDRISVLQRTEMALINLLGNEYKYRIEDWSRESDKLYTYKGKAEAFDVKTYSNTQQNKIKTYTINSNINLWDDAGWRGCSFVFDQQSRTPAIFGLAFLNFERGREIIAEWKSDYNVTIYIIKGIDSKHPTWYRVCVAPSLPEKEESTDRYCTLMCRKHTMTPNTNHNLKMFESKYRRFRGCWLMAFAINEDNSFMMPETFEGAFRFHNVEIREAYLIDPSDPAQIALDSDDEPYIPNEHKTNAPILQVLDNLKKKLKNK